MSRGRTGWASGLVPGDRAVAGTDVGARADAAPPCGALSGEGAPAASADCPRARRRGRLVPGSALFEIL
jgi:hypothetical protein